MLQLFSLALLACAEILFWAIVRPTKLTLLTYI